MDTPGYCILVADRSRNIRSFLKRELMAAGYVVHVAETGKHLIHLLYCAIQPDLLILDPDFPDIDVSVLTTKLQDRIPSLPVILHCPDMDILSLFPLKWRDAMVEKDASSVEVLKAMIPQALTQHVTAHKNPEPAESSDENTDPLTPEPSA